MSTDSKSTPRTGDPRAILKEVVEALSRPHDEYPYMRDDVATVAEALRLDLGAVRALCTADSVSDGRGADDFGAQVHQAASEEQYEADAAQLGQCTCSCPSCEAGVHLSPRSETPKDPAARRISVGSVLAWVSFLREGVKRRDWSYVEAVIQGAESEGLARLAAQTETTESVLDFSADPGDWQTAAIRRIGGCGAIQRNLGVACIMPLGHEGAHGWAVETGSTEHG